MARLAVVGPCAQAYVYGDVPPLVSVVSVPLPSPKHVTGLACMVTLVLKGRLPATDVQADGSRGLAPALYIGHCHLHRKARAQGFEYLGSGLATAVGIGNRNAIRAGQQVGQRR